MKKWFENKLFAGLLIAYFVVQLLSLFVHQMMIYLGYEILFLFALVQGSILGFTKSKMSGSLKDVYPLVGFLFFVNLILTLIYIPTLLLNPAINWTLEEGNEMDPMILLVFFPTAHFIIGAILIFVASTIGKLRFKR